MEIALKIVVFIGLYYKLVYRLNNQMSTWQMIRYVDQMTKSAYEMILYICRLANNQRTDELRFIVIGIDQITK